MGAANNFYCYCCQLNILAELSIASNTRVLRLVIINCQSHTTAASDKRQATSTYYCTRLNEDQASIAETNRPPPPPPGPFSGRVLHARPSLQIQDIIVVINIAIVVSGADGRESRATDMFAKARRRSQSSSQNTVPVSPLAERFDLDSTYAAAQRQQLNSPVSFDSRPSADSVQPRISTTTTNHPAGPSYAPRRSTIVSLQPPVLPPIPRVASRHEPNVSSAARKGKERRETAEDQGEGKGAHAEDSTPRPRGSAAGPDALDSDSLPLTSLAPPEETPSLEHSGDYPEISFDEPRMEATMFPRPQPQPPSDPYTAGPPMSRSFIDSRDRPYSHNVQRPAAVTSSYSSPDAIPPRSAAVEGLRQNEPSPTSRPNHLSAVSMEEARKTPSATGTNYSGSTARPSIQSSKSASASPLQQTIGTPYSETSSSFPAPQHVTTRPKTLGSSSTIAGVMVPTHHSNGSYKDQAKPEKRKTRLLNPMALLARRRSGQDSVAAPDEAERRAQAQAQARQKLVASVGINSMPEDFDPRIKGKIVHDFNAPRTRRTISSSDADHNGVSDRQLQSSDGLPAISITSDQDQHRPSLHSAQRSDVSSRHSRHTPIFVEHLYEESSNDGQAHSVHAERLENKDFLKRASHQSSPSQESSILPPFARRSQQLDPMQASFYRDDDSSKRSSEQSGSGNRESSASSGAAVSPIAARTSPNHSPISPDEPERNRRPVSDMSMIGGRFDTSYNQQSPESRGLPRVDPIAENTPSAQHPDWSQTDSPPAPKAVHPALRNLSSGPTSPKPGFPDSTSALSSPALDSSYHSTPEPYVADAVVSYQSASSPARLVEKRASAVGHSKPASSMTPKHHASNASRFSFQLDASAAEERALEDKHRRMAGAQASKKSAMDEDEDDYFDEDAMDDEDEMEAEMRMNDPVGGNGIGSGLGSGNTRSHLQPPDQFPRSDASSVYEEDLTAPPRNPELTYAEHPAFRAHSAVYSMKHNSVAPSSRYSSETSIYNSNTNNNNGWNPQHQRITSDATVMTLADSEYGANGSAAPRSDFYMQPHAAGYGGAGINATGNPGFNADSTMSVSTAQSNGAPPQRAMNTGSSPRASQHPRFSGFKFIDSPEHSRPPTSEDHQGPFVMANGRASVGSPDLVPRAPVTSPMALPSKNSYAHGSNSEGESAAYHGSIGQGIRARNVSMNQNLQYAASESGTDSTHDDMYFDDGGFSEDVQNGSGYGESINEDQFDNPDFAGGYRGMEPRGYHERHASAMTITSRDGPYPTFAMPNAGGKAQLRQSQMLLDDLPLQGPRDAERVPQRNPSDDAKRLGLSDLVPPLPAQPGAKEASPQMVAYHQALADAANRAAEEGRFERRESVSTSSVYSDRGEEEPFERDSKWADDRSCYNDDIAAKAATNTSHSPATNAETNRTGSQNAPNPRYTLPRMSGFDFGFNATMFDDINAAPTDELNAAPSDDINAPPTDDININHLEDDYDDGDDDFVAAANAEALAYDDSGFYGQEFGFYARARSDSAGSANGQALEAVNGGFFGDDGDDPLRRQNFSREPDLTPITERSEFSARNSFINFGPASATWNHGGVASPALARLPLSPLVGDGGQNKARASGGGYFGAFPAAGGPTHVQTHQQFMGASPASATNSPARPWTTSDSPVSATSSSNRGVPFASPQLTSATADPDATPRKPQAQSQTHFSSPLSDAAPGTAKKAVPLPAIRTGNGSAANVPTHSRNVSGADSVAYVRETVSPGEENSGPPRWVLERRRTSEFGVESVVGREVVRDGWI